MCFYEAAFLCGLKFPVHLFIMELLHYLNIAPRQLMPNSWRIIISCMVIWTTIANGDMITLNEFIHLCRLKESMSSCHGIEGLSSSLIYLRPSGIESLGIILCQVTVGRPFPTTFRGMSLGCCIGGRPLNLVCSPLVRKS